LLLEAGGTDKRLDILIPAGAASAYKSASWNYPIEPDPTRTNKPEGLLAGKVLGGGGSINGCVFVRGDRTDFDGWKDLGCDGWDYDSVLPLFKRMETWEGGASTYRGGEGPISVVTQKDRGIPNSAYFEAAQQAGHPIAKDYNGEAQDGVNFIQVNTRRGLRSQASREYLRRVASNEFLTLQTHALVYRVLFQGTRATGVEYCHNGEVKQAHARNEVIVSAGAMGSPKLLMLSGIGPPEVLARHGIPVIAKIPGVGQNLHDHPFLMQRWHTRGVRTINRLNIGTMLKGAWDFALNGTGILASTIPSMQFMGKTRASEPSPDLQFGFAPFAITREVDAHGVFNVQLAKQNGFTSCSTLLHPRSRGRVSIRSASPDDMPLVEFRFLDHPDDVRDVIIGLHEVRRVMAQPAMEAITKGPFEPEASNRTDADWERYVRSMVTSSYHPVGTCKMGVDNLAVVDPELRVCGVSSLRVVDASIMPRITSGNTNILLKTRS
jgi:choline dehydrogenase